MGCCCSSTAVASIRAGDEVVLSGLSQMHMNGAHATVVRWVGNASTSRDDGGRWLVELHLPGRKQISVLPVKCRLVSRSAAPAPGTLLRGVPIAVGSHVRIVGTANMDNSTGFVVGWLGNSQTSANDGGRWKVQLDLDGRVVALKPNNLVTNRTTTSVSSPTASASRSTTTTRSIPLISPVSSQPDREDYAAAGGPDAALGSAFNSAGKSNAETGLQVATAIAQPDFGGDLVIGNVIPDPAETPEAVVAEVVHELSGSSFDDAPLVPASLTPTDYLSETPDWLQ
jgi:hypothetical protein